MLLASVQDRLLPPLTDHKTINVVQTLPRTGNTHATAQGARLVLTAEICLPACLPACEGKTYESGQSATIHPSHILSLRVQKVTAWEGACMALLSVLLLLQIAGPASQPLTAATHLCKDTLSTRPAQTVEWQQPIPMLVSRSAVLVLLLYMQYTWPSCCSFSAACPAQQQ